MNDRVRTGLAIVAAFTTMLVGYFLAYELYNIVMK